MSDKKKTLVVVESPAKAKTIKKYLGKDYIVEASIGHVKDLKKYTLSVEIANNFKPIYEVIKGKEKIIQTLKKLAHSSKNILLATDPDREGEAIAWHIAEDIHQINPNIKRILFNEITKKGIEEGLKNARDLDKNLYLSQQARRVLDRLIGFKISPFLSNVLVRKTTNALSAGRVQSVTLRLICEREEDIEKFEPFVYFNVYGVFSVHNVEVKAQLIEYDGTQIKNPEGSRKPHRNESEEEYNKRINSFNYISNETIAQNTSYRALSENYIISNKKITQISRNPKPPFITSTLQQEAARKLGFSNQKTMKIAQELYEGVDIKDVGTIGLITYMRTDSVRVSNEAIAEVRSFIEKTYGSNYLSKAPIQYKSKSQNVQDAHEAIRPTMIELLPKRIKQSLTTDQFKLYELIFNRFIASQMANAKFEQTSFDIRSKNFVFRASGRVQIFDGFLKVYKEEEGKNSKFTSDDVNKPDDENKTQLPIVDNGDKATIINCFAEQKQTQPPPRYNSASLIKELEEKGIGRPSTYATIVTTLLNRKYIMQEKNAFIPTELGRKVNEILIKHFEDFFNVKFTAQMEKELDTIAEESKDYSQVVGKFYYPLENLLQKANNTHLEHSITCDLCGAPMVIRVSIKHGRFLGCSRYPECTNTKPLIAVAEKFVPQVVEDLRCPVCGKEMVLRKSKYGEFYGCIDYPKCKGTLPKITKLSKTNFSPLLIPESKCPKCGKEMLLRLGKKGYFLGCSNYPKCKGTLKVKKDEAEKMIEKFANTK
ncbi:MAG: type I DNA topoisomerase [Candidatus Kapaibacteriales bacterium]